MGVPLVHPLKITEGVFSWKRNFSFANVLKEL